MKSLTSAHIPDSKFNVPSQWQWHWRTLLRLRERLLQQTHEHFAAAATLQKADDPDFASLASEEHEFQSLVSEVKSEENLLGEVEAALERIRRGTYGMCLATCQPISPVRLRAVPWTRFTQEAAADRER